MDAGTWDGGTNVAKSLISFNGLGSALAGNRITSAELHVFDYWASTCTAEPFQVNPITQSWSPSGTTGWPGPNNGGSLRSGPPNPPVPGPHPPPPPPRRARVTARPAPAPAHCPATR